MSDKIHKDLWGRYKDGAQGTEAKVLEDCIDLHFTDPSPWALHYTITHFRETEDGKRWEAKITPESGVLTFAAEDILFTRIDDKTFVEWKRDPGYGKLVRVEVYDSDPKRKPEPEPTTTKTTNMPPIILVLAAILAGLILVNKSFLNPWARPLCCPEQQRRRTLA